VKSTTLIIPGLYGSGPTHWQTWLATRVADAQRVVQDDWNVAAIDQWAARVGDAIDNAVGQVWLVAHSFGCLAAVAAAVDRADRVAGALLVAPANPERFTSHGLQPAVSSFSVDASAAKDTITELIPHQPLGFPSIVVASSDDPWMRLTAASVWADRWGAQFECIGRAGHINIESGFGPWPQGLDLFERFRTAHGGEPLGSIEALTARRDRSDGNRNSHDTRQANDAQARWGERMLTQQWLA